jgi:hypothetical protein
MDKRKPTNLNGLRIAVTVIISVLIFSWLLWYYFHGEGSGHHNAETVTGIGKQAGQKPGTLT